MSAFDPLRTLASRSMVTIVDERLLYLVLIGALLTFIITQAVLKWLPHRGWLTPAVLSGLILPVLATTFGWLFMLMSATPGAGMVFAMVALLSFWSLPVCLATAIVTALVRKQKR